MEKYFHSVTLNRDECKGCTNCIKHCPTEAIRVRDGKAHILEERCIDCGECIRACPNHAKVAVTDPFDSLQNFAYKVVLPAPSFFGQFKPDIPPAKILGALLKLGFDAVYEVALGADYVTEAIRHYLRECYYSKPLISSADTAVERLNPVQCPKPLISSACPAVVRLIQVRFPNLIPHIMPIESPMEVSGRIVKAKLSKELGLPPEKIGTFFITPCPAKVTAVKDPVATQKSAIDGALSMAEVYSKVLVNLPGASSDETLQVASGAGIGWGRAGGENQAIGRDAYLSVDGIHNVIAVLEEVEMGKLNDIVYLECQSCPGGCIGGPLTVENQFISRVRIRKLAENLTKPFNHREEVKDLLAKGLFNGQGSIQPRPIMQLDPDISTAIQKMDELERTLADLPELDCGSCGAPSCRALAEDIVRGLASETDCIFKLRERVQALAEEMVDLSRKTPPAMGKKMSGE